MNQTFHQIRGQLVHFHLLQDDREVYLIDAGFIGAIDRLEAQLTQLGLKFSDIHAIILTHGHLDHTLNVAEIRHRSGCRVYAPLADRDHIAGAHKYHGLSRACGLAEAIGRRLLRYHRPEVDHYFEPGEILDCWGGLEVVPLPGHTLGHSGFLSHKHRLLFAGDLFSNYFGFPLSPPPWLNVDSLKARASLNHAAALDIDQVALNHCRRAGGETHLNDLRRLAARN